MIVRAIRWVMSCTLFGSVFIVCAVQGQKSKKAPVPAAHAGWRGKAEPSMNREGVGGKEIREILDMGPELRLMREPNRSHFRDGRMIGFTQLLRHSHFLGNSSANWRQESQSGCRHSDHAQCHSTHSTL